MKPYSIMIVDDDEVDRYTLKRLLRSGGVDALIEEAEDGEKAAEYFREGAKNVAHIDGVFPPIIVFLDINMPRMNGFEFLDEFQQLIDQGNNFRSVVFLMVSSSDNTEDKNRAGQYECVKGYIMKTPSTAKELLTHIDQFLPADFGSISSPSI